MSNNKLIIRDCLKYDVFDLIDKNFIFEKDNQLYVLLRQHISKFISDSIKKYRDKLILEIGPIGKPNEELSKNNIVETLDICKSENITYVADITQTNDIPKEHFDIIYCLDVLEHTYEPWEGLKQIHMLLKPKGVLYLSVPFQFRIHGPIPDCYRISEYGLKYLLQKYNFEIVQMNALLDHERPAFPIHYTIECIKK
jgi:predicted SAM-dependent methyltransferase